jgi:hypothetical protein
VQDASLGWQKQCLEEIVAMCRLFSNTECSVPKSERSKPA